METQLSSFVNPSLLASSGTSVISPESVKKTSSEVVKKVDASIESKVASEASSNDIKLVKVDEKQVLLKAEIAINEALLSSLNQKIGFDTDEQTGKTIIVIKNKETNEVIKQIPPQHFLDLVYNLNKAASAVLKDMPRYV